MSVVILFWSLLIAQLMLATAMTLAVVRLILGPRAEDRIVAMDTFSIGAMLLLVTFGIRTGSTLYFQAALIIALLGFVSMLALAKFLMRGEVIE